MKILINRIRDLILFVLLLILLKVAFDRKKGHQEHIGQVLSSAPISHEQEANGYAYYPDIPEQEIDPVPFSMPDLDTAEENDLSKDQESPENMLVYFNTANQQIANLIELTPSTSKEFAQLQSMRQRVDQLKQQYQRIVALENGDNGAVIQMGMRRDQIENNLLRIIQLIGRIAHIHKGSPENNLAYSSLKQGIDENDQLLNELRVK